MLKKTALFLHDGFPNVQENLGPCTVGMMSFENVQKS